MRKELAKFWRRLVKLELAAYFFSCLLGLAVPVDASDLHTDKSEIVLVAGEATAAGGMPQADFTALNVCDPNKLNRERVAKILGAALTSVRLSLDPATSDSYSKLELGEKWKTTFTPVLKTILNDYNSVNSDEKLPENLRIYFGFEEGEISFDGSLLTLFTRTTLVIGSSSHRFENYVGDWNSVYFHKLLQAAFIRGLIDYGCSLRN